MADVDLTELFITVKSIEREVGELKQTIKGDYQTKEGTTNIVGMVNENSKDIQELKDMFWKAVWLVLSTVITGIIYFWINGKQ